MSRCQKLAGDSRSQDKETASFFVYSLLGQETIHYQSKKRHRFHTLRRSLVHSTGRNVLALLLLHPVCACLIFDGSTDDAATCFLFTKESSSKAGMTRGQMKVHYLLVNVVVSSSSGKYFSLSFVLLKDFTSTLRKIKSGIFRIPVLRSKV